MPRGADNRWGPRYSNQLSPGRRGVTFLGKAYSHIRAARAALTKSEIATIENDAADRTAQIGLAKDHFGKATLLVRKAAEALEDDPDPDADDKDEAAEKAVSLLQKLAAKIAAAEGGTTAKAVAASSQACRFRNSWLEFLAPISSSDAYYHQAGRGSECECGHPPAPHPLRLSAVPSAPSCARTA